MSTTHALLGSSFDDWEDIYAYMSLYGVHIIVGAFLSAVTIYRREMSCNRVFHEEEEEEEEPSETSTMISDELETETEELLEGAGLYCSGQPILTFASLWLDCFPGVQEEPCVASKWIMQQEGLTTSELLERAGNFGEPILAAAMALFLLKSKEIPKPLLLVEQVKVKFDPFTNKLPPDVHVHISSFLHPKDVVTLSCVSKTYREVVDQSETAFAIWKTLWLRDYAWIINEWSVGQEALQRSNAPSLNIHKDFYFTFGQTYLNYVLAGQNTADRCLVGLHFHIYDITTFLDTHPGSPDTLMVYAGKDSTRFFEDMGHSLGARRLAQKLCVVADRTNADGDWGLRPTQHTVLVTNTETDDDNDESSNARVWHSGENLLLGRKQKRRHGTLQRIRTRLEREEEQVQRRILKRYGWDPSVLGQVNPYYDPFLQEWRIWYTNTDLQTVFLPA